MKKLQKTGLLLYGAIFDSCPSPTHLLQIALVLDVQRYHRERLVALRRVRALATHHLIDQSAAKRVGHGRGRRRALEARLRQNQIRVHNEMKSTKFL